MEEENTKSTPNPPQKQQQQQCTWSNNDTLFELHH